MTHFRAHRLLTKLLDGGLPAETRRALQAHLRGCTACRRRLREHEAVEGLVRLLPQALLPARPDPAAQLRLWGLARWFVDPRAVGRERRGLGALGVGMAVLCVAISLTASTWAPLPSGLVMLAQIGSPDVAAMLPLGWR